MIIGLDKTVVRKNQIHSNVANLAAGYEGPLLVVDGREEHRKHPLHGTVSILVPVNGTEVSRRAAEVAIALARATKAPLTALYVTSGSKAKPLAPQRGSDPERHRRTGGKLRSRSAHRGARRCRPRRGDNQGVRAPQA